MPAKIWQIDSLKNHLLAVRAGMRITLPPSLVRDGNGQLAAYQAGCDAAITYLAEKFGLDLDPNQPGRKPQTHELRLWKREDIKQDLEVAGKVMHASQSLMLAENPHLVAFYQGVDNTLHGLAQSFGIENLSLTDDQRGPGYGKANPL
ncbi:MAG: hypothetical protein L6R45_33605 [Anaerolineae bacterium]|nr:hypothetical protein [Anaerolineae bacterium]